jgi:hypothetical protein
MIANITSATLLSTATRNASCGETGGGVRELPGLTRSIGVLMSTAPSHMGAQGKLVKD